MDDRLSALVLFEDSPDCAEGEIQLEARPANATFFIGGKEFFDKFGLRRRDVCSRLFTRPPSSSNAAGFVKPLDDSKEGVVVRCIMLSRNRTKKFFDKGSSERSRRHESASLYYPDLFLFRERRINSQNSQLWRLHDY